jgi:hypothetical protein
MIATQNVVMLESNRETVVHPAMWRIEHAECVEIRHVHAEIIVYGMFGVDAQVKEYAQLVKVKTGHA